MIKHVCLYLIIIITLLIPLDSFAADDWVPDISSVKGQMELIFSVAARDPDTIAHAVRHHKNFLATLGIAQNMIIGLGVHANSTSIYQPYTVDETWSEEVKGTRKISITNEPVLPALLKYEIPYIVLGKGSVFFSVKISKNKAGFWQERKKGEMIIVQALVGKATVPFVYLLTGDYSRSELLHMVVAVSHALKIQKLAMPIYSEINLPGKNCSSQGRAAFDDDNVILLNTEKIEEAGKSEHIIENIEPNDPYDKKVDMGKISVLDRALIGVMYDSVGAEEILGVDKGQIEAARPLWAATPDNTLTYSQYLKLRDLGCRTRDLGLHMDAFTFIHTACALRKEEGKRAGGERRWARILGESNDGLDARLNFATFKNRREAIAAKIMIGEFYPLARTQISYMLAPLNEPEEIAEVINAASTLEDRLPAYMSDYLASLILHHDARVRVAALNFFWKKRHLTRQIREILLEAINDPERYVRMAAVPAIVNNVPISDKAWNELPKRLAVETDTLTIEVMLDVLEKQPLWTETTWRTLAVILQSVDRERYSYDTRDRIVEMLESRKEVPSAVAEYYRELILRDVQFPQVVFKGQIVNDGEYRQKIKNTGQCGKSSKTVQALRKLFSRWAT